MIRKAIPLFIAIGTLGFTSVSAQACRGNFYMPTREEASGVKEPRRGFVGTVMERAWNESEKLFILVVAVDEQLSGNLPKRIKIRDRLSAAGICSSFYPGHPGVARLPNRVVAIVRPGKGGVFELSDLKLER